MKPKFTLIAALAAAATVLPIAAAAMPPASAWDIGPWVDGTNYSVGMPAQPRGGAGGSVVMDFPRAGRGQVDALTTPIGPLAGARSITVRYRIDAAPGTRFIADEAPGQPATVSLYFQQRGDNWSGSGRFASYRWYVPARAVVPLTPGEHRITVRFDEVWTNVDGKPNSQARGGFSAALANTERLGVAFGSMGMRSHGVYATGAARFTLIDLSVN